MIVGSPPRGASSDPTRTNAIEISIILFLPTMSARRETIGVEAAPARRVAVTAQETLLGDAPRIPGKRGIAGTTSVCCNATRVPVIARTAVMSPAGRRDLTGAAACDIAADLI